MPGQNSGEKKDEVDSELENLQERYWDIHKAIVKTIKDRERVEKEYLAIIKNQMKYWKGQLDKVDPLINKNRYNELKKRIEVEKTLIKQIEEELIRIKEELNLEKEHEEKMINRSKYDK